MFIKSEDLFAFLRIAVQKKQNGITNVILPISPPSFSNGKLYFSQNLNEQIVLNSYRTIDPVKVLFYQTRERLTPGEFSQQKNVILGVKACDLAALQLLDRALLQQDFIDPAYKHWRENSIIVATDCGEISKTCHCNLVGGAPFAESGFDLNLSAVDEGFYIQIGSDKGDALLQTMRKSTKIIPANEKIKKRVAEQRRQVQQQLKTHNADFTRGEPEQLRSVNHDFWEEVSSACMGCGACTNICPTCYCLILNDETEGKEFIKVRSYDSCQWNGYATVAGGGTPRPKMSQRFRNRYLCKFDIMKNDFGVIGCTGCGRCSEACAAEIDFRRAAHAAESAAAAV